MGSTMGRRLLIMTRAIDEGPADYDIGVRVRVTARAEALPLLPGPIRRTGQRKVVASSSPGLCVSRRQPPPRPGYVFMYLLRWVDDAPEFLPKLVLLRGGPLVSRTALLPAG